MSYQFKSKNCAATSFRLLVQPLFCSFWLGHLHFCRLVVVIHHVGVAALLYHWPRLLYLFFCFHLLLDWFGSRHDVHQIIKSIICGLVVVILKCNWLLCCLWRGTIQEEWPILYRHVLKVFIRLFRWIEMNVILGLSVLGNLIGCQAGFSTEVIQEIVKISFWH